MAQDYIIFIQVTLEKYKSVNFKEWVLFSKSNRSFEKDVILVQNKWFNGGR